MRILVVHTNLNPDPDKHSAVDQWRLVRPIRELKKHCPDWQIDEQPTVIPDFAKYKDAKDFTEAEMEAAFKHICSYDIVFSSYQSNPTIFTLLQVARDKAGTQYIMDVDDDMFAINPDNPVWTKLTDERVYFMQRMIASNPWLCTTNEVLANRFRERREFDPASVFVIPNFIPDTYKHDPIDNGDKLVIGYFGGSTHYKDVHDTGFLPALERVMHEHKNVYFKSVGMIVDQYLPKARVTVEDGKKGDAWITDVFPSMNFDIAVAPLLDNIFNQGKSDIKWQESTRMGSLFVCSDVGPYTRLHDSVCLKTPNTEDGWYEALTKAVEDVEYRKATAARAGRVLNHENRLEDNWIYYKRMFELIHEKSKSLQPSAA